MNTWMTILLSGSIATIIPILLNWFINRKKSKADASLTDVEIIEKYKTLFGSATTDLVEWRTKCRELESKISTVSTECGDKIADLTVCYEQELNVIRISLKESEERAKKYEDWARRLVGQLQMEGLVPVPFEIVKKAPSMGITK